MGSQHEPLITEFWCHSCSHIIRFVEEEDVDQLVCPFCLSSFVEEIDINSSHEILTVGPDLVLYEWIPVLRSLQNSLLRLGVERYNESQSDDNYDILQKKLHREAVIEKLLDAIVVINRHQGIESSLSFGPQLDRILEYLSENPPSRYHTDDLLMPKLNTLLRFIDDCNCANKGVLTVRIDQSARGEKCTICLDDFVVGQEASKVPCKHMFHCKCIKTWLEVHNSCPVCRFELPGEVLRCTTGDANSGRRSPRRGRRFWMHSRWLFCMGLCREQGQSSATTSPLGTR